MTQEWKKISRRWRAARFLPTISIRRNGFLAISADFVRMAKIEDCTRVTLFLAANGMRLGIQFHSDERDDDAFILGHDGGNRKSLNRIVVAKTLITQSDLLRSLLNEDSRVRRFEPQRDENGRWIINLAPCFERRATEVAGLPKQGTGIYRYVRGQEVIYIGRGDLRNRAASQERKQWDFDVIEYSILNDEMAEKKWEAFWLNEFRRRNGVWPKYNKLAGIIDEAS